MKASFIISVFIFTLSGAYSQPKGAHLYQIKDKRLARVLSMMDTTITIANNDMTVRLYHIWNPFGSAHIPGDDEVSESYMVSIGEDQGIEMPADHLFSLGEFYGPKLLQFKETGKNTFSIIIEHGVYAHRKKSKFLVTRTNVVLLK